LAKNLCGVCTRMPAPSPARGSAPTAPRCSRLSRIVSASSTSLCDFRPLMSAMNPTPQESFSSVGSNSRNFARPLASSRFLAPLAAASNGSRRAPRRIVRGAAPPHPLPRAESREGVAPKGEPLNSGGNLRAAWRPRLLLRHRTTRPRPGGWRSRISPPTFSSRFAGRAARGCFATGHKLGQQCCPMLNIANSGHKHKGEPRLRCFAV